MPGDLWHYWAEGAGRTRIPWGSPGDFYACRVVLGEYLEPGQVNGACEELHQHILGISTAEHAKELGGEHKHPSTAGDVIAARLKGNSK